MYVCLFGFSSPYQVCSVLGNVNKVIYVSSAKRIFYKYGNDACWHLYFIYSVDCRSTTSVKEK